MLHVQPKPGGGIGLPRLLLVKPGRAYHEFLHGCLCDNELDISDSSGDTGSEVELEGGNVFVDDDTKS